MDDERCFFGEVARRERRKAAPTEKDPRSLENLLATYLDIALPHARCGGALIGRTLRHRINLIRCIKFDVNPLTRRGVLQHVSIDGRGAP